MTGCETTDQKISDEVYNVVIVIFHSTSATGKIKVLATHIS